MPRWGAGGLQGAETLGYGTVTVGARPGAFAKLHRLCTAHWEPQRELGTSTSNSRVAPRHRLLSRPWRCPLRA